MKKDLQLNTNPNQKVFLNFEWKKIFQIIQK